MRKKVDVDITDISKSKLTPFFRKEEYDATNFNATGADRQIKANAFASGRLPVSAIQLGTEDFVLSGENRNIVVKEGELNKIVIGRRPDGSYGITVADTGYDAFTAYTGESLLASTSNPDYKEFNPANFTYSSSTRINISNYDPTKFFQKGDKLWIVQTTNKFFYIVSVTSTYIDVAAGTSYSVSNAPITYIATSRLDRPSGFPTTFKYSTTPTPSTGSISSSTVLINEFSVSGDRVTCYFNIQFQASGVDEITLPIPIKAYDYGSAGAWYAGTALTVSQLTPAMGYISMFQTVNMNTVLISAELNPVTTFENDSAVLGEISYKLA